MQKVEGSSPFIRFHSKPFPGHGPRVRAALVPQTVELGVRRQADVEIAPQLLDPCRIDRRPHCVRGGHDDPLVSVTYSLIGP